jgi:hypothetical protein
MSALLTRFAHDSCATTGSPAAILTQPQGLSQRTRLSADHCRGERATTDILALTRKRTRVSLTRNTDHQPRRQNALYGSTLALAAITQT